MDAAEFYGVTEIPLPLRQTEPPTPCSSSSQLRDGATQQHSLHSNFLASQTANSSLPAAAELFKGISEQNSAARCARGCSRSSMNSESIVNLQHAL